MFVTNHVLSGVVIGRVLRRHPVAAFAVGVVSHLVLDACPHWGCEVDVPGGKERFLRVAQRDGVLGLAAMAALAAAAEPEVRAATVAAMAGAVLLDLDKPCDHFFGFDPFPAAVSRFHKWVQNQEEHRLPHEIGFGTALAVLDGFLTASGRRRSRMARSPVLPAA